eukprot:COSAG04_NODE_31669_length_255_cov_1.000000_1_plen_55_part_10
MNRTARAPMPQPGAQLATTAYGSLVLLPLTTTLGAPNPADDTTECRKTSWPFATT